MRKRPRKDGNLPLLEHVLALRKVLVVSAYAIVAGSMIGWFFSDLVFAYLAGPVTLLEDIRFITTTPMEPMLVKLKVSMFLGIFLALPVLMWQLWSFVLQLQSCHMRTGSARKIPRNIDTLSFTSIGSMGVVVINLISSNKVTGPAR